VGEGVSEFVGGTREAKSGPRAAGRSSTREPPHTGRTTLVAHVTAHAHAQGARRLLHEGQRCRHR